MTLFILYLTVAEADKKRVTSRYQSLTELPLRQDYNIDQVDRDDAVNLVTRQHPHFGQLATKMDEFRKDGIFCDINLVLPHDGVTLKVSYHYPSEVLPHEKK